MVGFLFWLALWSAQSAQSPASKDDTEKPPKPLEEVVVVTASRSRESLLETTSLASVLQARDLETIPGLVLDEKLRRIPGFSLFRRTSSLTAHPTTQGVSLRGIGPSGTSRSLVLFDGIPLNDPFGGWVYWNRFPVQLLEQVEVVRGSGSNVYGSASMAGTIQLIPRKPDAAGFEFQGLGGNGGTADVSALTTNRKGDWGVIAGGRYFHTDGFLVVPDHLRGTVDRKANSEFGNFFGRVYYKKNAHLGFNFYREERGNGTELQRNRSRIAQLEGGLQGADWRAVFYSQWNRLESSFSRISPDRNSEFPTAQQDFPSLGLGASAVWNPAGRLTVGTDWRFARWQDNDQHLAGLFVQNVVPLQRRLEWLLGIRLDMWQNRGTRFISNPRSGLRFRATDRVSLRASVYRGFRAPTLNELYRPFRVGNILTLANDELRAEHLWGGEGGLDWAPAANTLLRVNGFWNSLRRAVGNVTIGRQDNLILRQRQNQGRAAIRGLELEVIRQTGAWQVQGAYLFTDTRLAQTGLRIPQVPDHQATLGLSYFGAPVRIYADARWNSAQFEDDLNQLNLASYVVFDVGLSRPLSDELEVFLSAQNLLDHEYAVGRTPIERLGDPRLVQAGIRWRMRR